MGLGLVVWQLVLELVLALVLALGEERACWLEGKC